MTTTEFVVPRGDVPLAVRLHTRDAGPRPAVLVTGSWLTVREQMPDHYAAALADRGFAAFTFDFAGFGASGGGLRQTEIPARKVADLIAVAEFVNGLSLVAPGGPALLSICATAQYGLAALAAGAPVRAFASVAGWFHDAASVAQVYGGAAGVAERLARADAAARRFTATGDLSLVPAYADGDERAGMFFRLDYYADPGRGAVPAWRTEMSELTWAHWLTFDGLAAAPAVSTPTVPVHSDDCVFPDNVRTVAGRLAGPVEVSWGAGAQTDFYDRPEQTAYALDAVEGFLR